MYTSMLTGGTPPKVETATGSPIQKTPLNDMADSRDIISMFVGTGSTSLKDQDTSSAYNRLTQIVGEPLARKLATQAMVFNQRPDVQKLNPEQRVNHFFKLGSNDKEVSDYIGKVGSLGTGPVDAFRNSALLKNSNLQGKYVMSDPGATAASGIVRSLLGKRIGK